MRSRPPRGIRRRDEDGSGKRGHERARSQQEHAEVGVSGGDEPLPEHIHPRDRRIAEAGREQGPG